MARLGDPAEIKPKRLLTTLANDRCAKVGAVPIVSIGLISRINRLASGLHQERSHGFRVGCGAPTELELPDGLGLKLVRSRFS